MAAPARCLLLSAACSAALAFLGCNKADASSSSGSSGVATAETCAAGSGGAGCAAEGPDLTWEPKSISVVLPCANEGKFVLKTVKAVADSIKDGSLKEIIVVDDGSRPAVKLGDEKLEKYKTRIVRHEKAQGLIRSKSTGGNNATGDLIVFFDCHVAPQKGWHTLFLKSMKENYRRIVVPSITDLDVDTWKQRNNQAGVSKCYLTWDADFKWYSSAQEHIPILSGGLLGISQRWWKESGGYDDQMVMWGGENIDQSLRTWLCGGEIVALPRAEVAHMWRKPEDPQTMANYEVDTLSVMRNRARAAKGWYGANFSQKLNDYFEMGYTRWKDMDVSSFHEVQNRLQCKPFAWFLWRFKDIYEDGGLLPAHTFRLEHVKSGQCLTFLGPSGTHPSGRDKVALAQCGSTVRTRWPNRPLDQQRWHEANRNRQGKCCSGFRAWNTDQCINNVGTSDIGTTICDVAGRQDMFWSLTKEDDPTHAPGQLMHPNGWCVQKKKDSLKLGQCKTKKEGKNGKPMWRMTDLQVPLETRLYRQMLKEQPELFS